MKFVAVDRRTSFPEIWLMWSGGSGNHATTKVQRRTNSDGTWGPWTLIATYPGPYANAYSDYGTTSGTKYQYRVRGCNALGCASYRTAPAIVSPYPAPPAAPATIAATAISGTEVSIGWSNVANETRFELQRRVFVGSVPGAWDTARVLAIDVVSYSDVAVSAGTRYGYRARACNAGGCSAYVNAGARTP